MIKPEDLKQLTIEAVQRAKEENDELLRQTRVIEELNVREQRAKADSVIGAIPGRARQEALAGRRHAIVYSLDHREHGAERPSYDAENCYRALDVFTLIGVAKLVWEACDAAKLQPTLEFWHDGVGVNSGWNIVIHW